MYRIIVHLKIICCENKTIRCFANNCETIHEGKRTLPLDKSTTNEYNWFLTNTEMQQTATIGCTTKKKRSKTKTSKLRCEENDVTTPTPTERLLEYVSNLEGSISKTNFIYNQSMRSQSMSAAGRRGHLKLTDTELRAHKYETHKHQQYVNRLGTWPPVLFCRGSDSQSRNVCSYDVVTP